MRGPSVSVWAVLLLVLGFAFGGTGCGKLIAEISHPLLSIVKRGPLQSFEAFDELHVSVFPAAMVMPVGEQQQLTITVKDKQNRFVNVPVSVESMNASVAGLQERTVLGVSVGKTTVVVSAGGTTVLVPVTVIPALETPLKIDGPVVLNAAAIGEKGKLKVQPPGSGRGSPTPGASSSPWWSPSPWSSPPPGYSPPPGFSPPPFWSPPPWWPSPSPNGSFPPLPSEPPGPSPSPWTSPPPWHSPPPWVPSEPPPCNQAGVWTSDNPAAVAIEQDGTYTTRGAGCANLSYSACGLTSNTVTICVEPRPFIVQATGPNGESSLALTTGGTSQLKGWAIDANNNALPIDEYLSDVSAIAAVETAGAVTARNPGSTYGRAKAGGITSPNNRSVLLSVDQPPQPPEEGDVVVFPTDLTLEVGDSFPIEVRKRNPDGTVVAIAASFVSASAPVAGVNADGLITAISPGTTYVTVSGNGFLKYVTVRVVSEQNTGISVTPKALSATAFGPVPTPLSAVRDGETTPLVGVTWETSNAGIATIDANGVLTAVGDGVVTITARWASYTDTMTFTVNQLPAFITVHSTLNGDPRTIITHGPASGVGISATAYDFNGNPMAIERILSEDGTIASVSGQTAGDLQINGLGSTYLRAISKGVMSDIANSIRVVAFEEPLPPVFPPPESPSPSPSGTPPPPVGCPTCNNNPPPPVVPTPTPTVTPAGPSLDVNPDVMTLVVGESAQITATIRDADWNVLPGPAAFTPNTANLSVSHAGLVTAGAVPGNYQVTVSTLTASKVVVVNVVAAPPGDDPELKLNISNLTVPAYGNIPTLLEAESTATGAVFNFVSLTPGIVNLQAGAGASRQAYAIADGVGTIRVDDGLGNQENITITVAQRASYMYVRLNPAFHAALGDPREVFMANAGQSARVQGFAVDQNGYYAWAPGGDPFGWSVDNLLTLVTDLRTGGVAGPVAPAAAHAQPPTFNGAFAATARGTGLANGATFIRIAGKNGSGGTFSSNDYQSLKVVVGDAAAASVDATVILP